MITVHKFPLPVQPIAELIMPEGAKVIHADYQQSEWDWGPQAIMVWALVDDTAAMEERLFFVTGTGHPVPEGVEHVATVQISQYVWHVWEPAG